MKSNWRRIQVDSERKRVLIVVRRPGKKLCARILWTKSNLVLLSSMVDMGSIDFGHQPLPKT